MEKKVRPRKEQDITAQVNQLRLPDKIKITAINVKSKIKVSGKRGNNLNKLVFFCVYCAYMESEEVFTPEEIARICDIDDSRKELNKVFKMFPQVVTGYSPPDDNKTPLDYIKNYFKISKLHDTELEKVLQIGKSILDKSKELRSNGFAVGLEDQFPQSVAIGLIFYYLDLNGFAVEYNKEHADGISWSTVTGIIKRITLIDNS